jgi:hypothetical protein
VTHLNYGDDVGFDPVILPPTRRARSNEGTSTNISGVGPWKARVIIVSTPLRLAGYPLLDQVAMF